MNNIPSLGPSTIPDIEPLIFSCNGVKQQPQSLKDDKAPGLDNHYNKNLVFKKIIIIKYIYIQSIIYVHMNTKNYKNSKTGKKFKI